MSEQFTQAAAHAEVEQVWPENGEIRVLGRLHGLTAAAPQEGWLVQCALREPRGLCLEHPASVSGEAFEAVVPIAALAPPEAPGKGVWDVHLVNGGERLRVGRRLDDIRAKNTIMIYPAQTFPAGGGQVEVRPRYTVHENLSIDYQRVAGTA
ncbi:hypothetical protein DP939_39760 [Spongiactinospora rosea]|uniref:Uncharacterized protein n=1 Tax=Spongiactinospora rosea TaxID=2248750 RepID=A0A366LKW5_9ACTN|nr:hypothetical protein [Spongiactinospora rosea]RBQ14575.1 hypothetical protein DP939_39760 [Spongiactinospora rosea]